jgi:hypothetical protein
MNERLNLKTRFEKLSIDELVGKLDQYADVDEPTEEVRILEEVLAQKISEAVKVPVAKEAGQSPEPERDGRTCPPAINQVSGIPLNHVVGDPNSTEGHVDMFGPELKPSLAPRWKPDHIPAVPVPAAVGATPIHKDGTQANTFVGEVPILPGMKIRFNNTGRSA